MKTLKFLILLAVLLKSGVIFPKDISVILEFKKKPTALEIESIKKTSGVKEIKLFDHFDSNYFSRLYELTIEEGSLSQLKNISGIKRSEKVTMAETFSITPALRGFSNDPFSNYQWGVLNQGQNIIQDLDDINFQTLYSQDQFDIGARAIRSNLSNLMKRDVLVAVIDSGVDIDHEDLKANIFRNTVECKNNELPYGLLTDKDKNGYIGDCMGWNFVNNNNRPYDDKGHGTHVAGIIGAVSDNNKGISGIVSSFGARIKILPIKVYQGAESVQSSGMVAFTDKIAKGVLYAIKMKADVINLSLGWPKIMDTEYLRQAVKEAQKNGITIVSAAGNNGHARPLYPCAYEGVICVGASSVNGESTSFSNYGSHVDIVAPGDQILSTYPKKLEPSFFSALGYEIMNGTSQAAPFVSSSVAILKSIYPEMDADELMARLLSTTSEVKGEKYFRSGELQLAQAIAWEKKPFVIPVFKNLSQVNFKMSSKQFSLELPLKNYGEASSAVQVKILLDSHGLHLEKDSFEFPEFAKGQTQNISLLGLIDDVSSAAQVKMKILITEGEKTQEFKHEIVLARDLAEDGFIKKAPFNAPEIVNELAVTFKDGLYAKLKTVEDPYRVQHDPEYFFEKINATTKALELWLFKKVNGSFVSQKVVIPDANKIGGVRKVDLDYDGQDDYFIESKSGSDKAKIIYSYLKADFSPVVGKGHFDYIVRDAYSAPYKITFVPKMTKAGMIAHPFFIESGYIPKEDESTDPWTPTERTLDLHAYYLNLDLATNSFSVKLFDNALFNKRIENELGKSWDENLSFVGQGSDNALSYQSVQELRSGKISFMIAVGREAMQRYYEVDVKKDFSFSFTERLFPSSGKEDEMRLPLVKIDGEQISYQAGSVLAGLQNNALGHMLFIEKGNISELRYDHSSQRDSIVGAVGAFNKDGKLLSYYQSKNKILRISSEGETLSYPIERVSFVTGAAFTELYYPLVVKGHPSFYVDATKIHSGHIFLLEDKGDAFVSPMKHNVYIPANCASMNPVKYEGEESFAFVCKEGNALVMNYLTLN